MQSFTTSSWRLTTRDSHSLERFIQDIKRYEPLTPEQEYEAFCALRAGDVRQADRIVRHNQRFLLSVAKLYYKKEGGALMLGDLVNTGNEGLLEAIKRFDHTRGFKFISYAVKWIRKYISQETAREGGQISLPPHLYFARLKERRIQDECLMTLGRMATEEEIEAGLSEKDYSMLCCSRDAAQVGHSLDAPLRESEDSAGTAHDYTASECPIQDQDEAAHQATFLRLALQHLPPKEAAIIQGLYGLEGDEVSRPELQRRLKMSKSGLEFAHKRGLEKLRQLMQQGR